VLTPRAAAPWDEEGRGASAVPCCWAGMGAPGGSRWAPTTLRGDPGEDAGAAALSTSPVFILSVSCVSHPASQQGGTERPVGTWGWLWVCTHPQLAVTQAGTLPAPRRLCRATAPTRSCSSRPSCRAKAPCVHAGRTLRACVCYARGEIPPRRFHSRNVPFSITALWKCCWLCPQGCPAAGSFPGAGAGWPLGTNDTGPLVNCVNILQLFIFRELMTLNKADFNLIGYCSCHVNPGHQSRHQSERHERLRRPRQLLRPGAPWSELPRPALLPPALRGSSRLSRS